MITIGRTPPTGAGSTDAASGPAGRIGSAGWISALICLLVGLVIRMVGLGAKPLWLDEVTTLHRSALPLGRMVLNSLSFHHLPTYFVITSWFGGLGHDEWALRLPAALFGALSCGLACLLAAWLRGAAAGFAAGMLMAAAPIEVQYGQEARSYTMILCLVLTALWGLLALVRERPAGSARPLVALPLAAYAAGTLGALLTLGVGIAWFVIANLAVLALRLRDPALAFLTRPWLAVQAAILVLATPAYVAMTVLVDRAHGTFESGLDWIPRLSWAHVSVALQSLYTLRVSSLIAEERLFPSPLPLVAFLPAILCLAALGALRAAPRARLLLVLICLACPIGMIAASLVTPILMPRYLLWSTGPFFVLAGTGVAVLPPRLRAAASVAIAVLALLDLRPYYREETKPRWELAARTLTQLVRPGDLLLTDDPGAVDLMNVFLARTHRAIERVEWTTSVTDASCALYAGREVWAVQGRVGQVDRENFAQFLVRLAPLGRPVAVRRIGLDITLLRYDRPAGDCAAEG